MADVQRRFRSLSREITKLIYDDDILGLRPSVSEWEPHTAKGPITNAKKAWQFQTDDKKLASFGHWLDNMVSSELLDTLDIEGVPTEPWISEYTESAYKKGMVRGYVDSHKDTLGVPADFIEGSKAEFLQSAFSAPETTSKIRLLATRSFNNMKGVSEQAKTQLNFILAQGMANGDGAGKIARDMTKKLGIPKSRAMMIARTEIVHAHAEGQLDAFEKLGVEELGVMAEWHTAGDAKVCPRCRPLEGVILTVSEARGGIPRHPNCRCAWIPANVGEKTTGQVWSDKANDRIRESILAEVPKKVAKQGAKAAREASVWPLAKKGALPSKAKLKPVPSNAKAIQAKKKLQFETDKGDAAKAAAEVQVKLEAAKAQAQAKVAAAKAEARAKVAAAKAKIKEAKDAAAKKALAKEIADKEAIAKKAAAKKLADEEELFNKAALEEVIAASDEVETKAVNILADLDGIVDDLPEPVKFAEKVYEGALDGISAAKGTVAKTNAYKLALEKGEALVGEAEHQLKLLGPAKLSVTKSKYKDIDNQIHELLADVDALEVSPLVYKNAHTLYEEASDKAFDFGQTQLSKIKNISAANEAGEQLVKTLDQAVTFKVKKNLVEAKGKSQTATSILADVEDEWIDKVDSLTPTDEMLKTTKEVQATKKKLELMDEDANPTLSAVFHKKLAQDADHMVLLLKAQIKEEAAGVTKEIADAAEAATKLDKLLMDEVKVLKASTGDLSAKIAQDLDALDVLEAKVKQAADFGTPAELLADSKAANAAKGQLLKDVGNAIDEAELAALAADDLAKAVLPSAKTTTKTTAELNADLIEAMTAESQAQKALAEEISSFLDAGGSITDEVTAAQAQIKAAEDAVLSAQINGTVTDKITATKALIKAKEDLSESLGEEISKLFTKAKAAVPKTAAEIQSHKVKMGMAPKHYAKPKFGGGVVESDYLSPKKSKLNDTGLNKVLSEKGWHSSTLPSPTMEALKDADDLVAQKAIMDKLKKAPKGTPKPPSAVPPALADLPTGAPFPHDADLVKIQDLSGSTRPYLAESTKDGSKWVVKSAEASGIAPDHLRSEALADALYRRAGLATPRSTVLETSGGPMKVAQFLEGGETLGDWRRGKTAAQIAAMDDSIQDGFVMDALLANHDVAGLDFDNIFIVKGKPVRIDNGGAMTFRAQGQAKQTWGPKVLEIDSMRDANINRQTASMYKGLSESRINEQIQSIMDKREEILGAIDDPVLRSTMAARMDDLKARLPAKPVKARPTASKAGVRAVEYEVTPRVAERVKESTSNGVVIASDRGDIEDLNILAWAEEAQDGTPLTKIQLKVTTAGDAKIQAVLGGDLKTAKVVTPTGEIAHVDDNYWATIKKAAGNVNFHAKDGTYNLGHIANMDEAADQIAVALKTATGSKKKMLEHYQDQIKQVHAAKASQTTTAWLDPFTYTPEAPKASAAVPRLGRQFKVNKDREVNFRSVTFDKGKGRGDGGINTFEGDDFYSIDAGEGITIQYSPRTASVEHHHGMATRGTVNVTIPEGVSDTSIKKAMGILEELGLDPKPPTPEYEELLYLHRTIYLRNDHNLTDYVKITGDAALDDSQKIAKIKQWAAKRYEVDFDNMPNYNPSGHGLNDKGEGFRHWERWDIDRDQMAEAMEGYTLQHTTGELYESPEGKVAGLIRGVGGSGGEFTTTTGRLRKGVWIGDAGASTRADMTTGGANYFFTRVRPDKVQTRGIFFSVDNLARQDTLSYRSDKFGAVNEMSTRGAVPADYKSFADSRGNESVFKEGLSMDDIDFIRVRPSEKADVIKAFHDNGVTHLPDGREVGSIITTNINPPKNRKKKRQR
jgi:SPP1 gp7 family putative phage head morphogenesis protein